MENTANPGKLGGNPDNDISGFIKSMQGAGKPSLQKLCSKENAPHSPGKGGVQRVAEDRKSQE